MSAASNMKTVITELYTANTEKGNNKSKRAHLEAARTALVAAKAATGAGSFVSGQLAIYPSLYEQIIFAEEMEDNKMNGSTGLALNEKRGAEYFHVDKALTLAQQVNGIAYSSS